MTVGERIKARRKELNISVDELADMINKNRATIYRYENEEIENLPITILEPLAKALRTTPGQLMGWVETTEIPNTLMVAEDSFVYNAKKNDIDNNALNTLKTYFDNLNEIGIEEALKRVKELTYIPLYCKNGDE